MLTFRTPKESLGDLDGETAAALITAATDLALVVDRDGTIRDLACSSDDLAGSVCERWLGRPWIDTVTVESRPKIEALLREAAGRSVLSV